MMPRGHYDRNKPEIPDGKDSIIMSIRLKSGRFESSIEVPLYASEKERQDFVEQWLLLMEAGLKIGHLERSKEQG